MFISTTAPRPSPAPAPIVPAARTSSSSQLAFVASRDSGTTREVDAAVATWIKRRRRARWRVVGVLVAVATLAGAVAVGASAAEDAQDAVRRSAATAPTQVTPRFEVPLVETMEVTAFSRAPSTPQRAATK
jgi:hypothetical protein